jgi:hypothetical protein
MQGRYVGIGDCTTYIRILSHHLGHLGRNHFTLLTPCCCALEDRDAFVHDGFEVFGFGVEGGNFRGGHCWFRDEWIGYGINIWV